MDEGSLFGLEGIIKTARSAVISALSKGASKDIQKSLSALQIVMQEQQHTAALLESSTDVGGLWEGEMRFYSRPGGSFECRCAGLQATVNSQNMDRSSDTVLVTTDITKEVRRAFFHAAFGRADVLLVDGVAGTGKTETCRDICHMLGMTHAVMNASKTRPTDAIEWLKAAQPGSMLIIDEAHHFSRTAIEDAVRRARDAHVTLCFTSNAQQKGDNLTNLAEVVGSVCAYAHTEVPPYPIVISSMLACEGLQQADNLGNRLNGLFDYLKANCSKQHYYDWGLRKLKNVVSEAGRAARSASFADERQILTAAVQASCASGLAPIDESVLFRGLLDHFGPDAFVPMARPRDFWNAAATKISRTVASRHGTACLPVLESEETFVMAVIEEEAAKAGASISCMPGRMADLTQHSAIGGFSNGEWKDGRFTQSLRDMVDRDQPGWLVVFCGPEDFAEEKWHKFNTLFDDNKCLLLESGEKITLKPADRIILAAQSLKNAPPALVSRLGVINVEANHRNRL